MVETKAFKNIRMSSIEAESVCLSLCHRRRVGGLSVVNDVQHDVSKKLWTSYDKTWWINRLGDENKPIRFWSRSGFR